MTPSSHGVLRILFSAAKHLLTPNAPPPRLPEPASPISSAARALVAPPCFRLLCIRIRSHFSSSILTPRPRLFSSSAAAPPSQSKLPPSSDSRKPIGRVADRPKGPRPSTPLSVLSKSRSTRYRESAGERGLGNAGTAAPKLSHRLRRIQEVSQTPKKKKKRPPPGPLQFEELTARTPVRAVDVAFDFRHSYTEIPKVEPIGFQEKFSPFGPGRLDRPWNGQAAVLAPSTGEVDGSSQISRDLKRKESFDSFNPPPRKKGIKPVTPPGPFLPGGRPRRAKTREQILGEPLTKEEVTELVEEGIKSKKQINIGRDGLTHNMLIDFHNHWKRERLVRVKCKGVCTVDMDNVLFQIEDKTGGKVIHRAGGTVYVFRGRNYNYRDTPNIPRMLWKPHSPIYPRLISDNPGGLSLQEANELRKRSRKIMPLCKLAKNGYYADLVQNVREAFEDDDIVRIDCKGLNISDYKKVGAKLRDLVPCVLVSFQREQILVWKGRDENVSNAGVNADVDSGDFQRPEHGVADGNCEDAEASDDGSAKSVDAGYEADDGSSGDAQASDDSPEYLAKSGELHAGDTGCEDVEASDDGSEFATESADTSDSSGIDDLGSCIYSSDDEMTNKGLPPLCQ